MIKNDKIGATENFSTISTVIDTSMSIFLHIFLFVSLLKEELLSTVWFWFRANPALSSGLALNSDASRNLQLPADQTQLCPEYSHFCDLYFELFALQWNALTQLSQT